MSHSRAAAAVALITIPGVRTYCTERERNDAAVVQCTAATRRGAAGTRETATRRVPSAALLFNARRTRTYRYIIFTLCTPRSR